MVALVVVVGIGSLLSARLGSVSGLSVVVALVVVIASGGVVEVVGIGASIRVALSSLATCCYGIGAAIGSLTVVVTRQYQGGSRSSKNDDLEELHV
ncbi:hypothetical protein F4819DRAFT_455514, partial [Hypoxylon fuscum]